MSEHGSSWTYEDKNVREIETLEDPKNGVDCEGLHPTQDLETWQIACEKKILSRPLNDVY